MEEDEEKDFKMFLQISIDSLFRHSSVSTKFY